jgi:hypothetical protein
MPTSVIETAFGKYAILLLFPVTMKKCKTGYLTIMDSVSTHVDETVTVCSKVYGTSIYFRAIQ